MHRLILNIPAILFGIVIFFQPQTVRGAELLDVQVDKEDKRYTLYSETTFEVGHEALYELLIDYEKFEKFTSAIVESMNIEPDEQGRPRFFARMEGCALLFCKSFIRNGHLVLKPKSEIVAIANPETSDFNFSHERWRLIPRNKGTLLIYDFEMEPAFWIPPVIGPFLIQRALKRGAIRAVNRIERLALEIENETSVGESAH